MILIEWKLCLSPAPKVIWLLIISRSTDFDAHVHQLIPPPIISLIMIRVQTAQKYDWFVISFEYLIDMY